MFCTGCVCLWIVFVFDDLWLWWGRVRDVAFGRFCRVLEV